MPDLTLEQVRGLERMARHNPDETGTEWWWGPNGGVRGYWPHGIEGKSAGIVVHAEAQTNAIIFPTMDPTKANLLKPEPMTFGRIVYRVPTEDWHHLAGCTCEFCK